MVVLFLAHGFEEIEALMPLDLLRRAGVEVQTVAIGGSGEDARTVTGSHGIGVLADVAEREFIIPQTIDMVILPGGMPGATNLDASATVDATLREAQKQDAYLCAICAAPLVLGRRGMLVGKNATCYPGFENELVGASCQDTAVVCDGNLITAKGMGVALDFAKAIVSALCGDEATDALSRAIMEKN